jgi:enediyne biosynthesis protein E4
MGLRATRAFTLCALIALGVSARLPDHDSSVVTTGRFLFETHVIGHRLGEEFRQTRNVHKDLAHIQPWVSSVGAAVAVGDIDGNLKADDVCYVETRSNQVIVAPAFGSRFQAFAISTSDKTAATAPMGCLIADLNEDGLADLVVYYWGRTPIAFLRIEKSPGSAFAQPAFGEYRAIELAANERWFTNAALVSDIDGDGHLDLVFGNYFCDAGHILDDSTKASVCPSPPMQDSMSRAYNGGTKRVLLWSNASSGSAPEVLFHEQKGVFPNEVMHSWTLAIGAQDLNGDVMPDLYFANDFGPDRLLINCSLETVEVRKSLGCFPTQGRVSFRMLEGERGLTKPRSKVLGKDSFKGMGVDFVDLNDDGIPDIFVSNITESWGLQESQFLFLSDGRRIDHALLRKGVAPYSDESERLGLARSGWAWDAKFGDFDNDGVLEAVQAVGFVRGRNSGLLRKSCWAMLQELATANDELLKYPRFWFGMEHDSSGLGCDLSGRSRNPFFVFTSSGRYVDVAERVEHVNRGADAPSRGLAMADIDGDGRLDYLVAKQFAPLEVHLNRSQTAAANAFIVISPRYVVDDRSDWPASVIPRRSRPAVGARVVVRLPDGRTIVREVDGGNGHSGKRSPDIHIGLGPRLALPDTVEVEVSWRSNASRVSSQQFNLAIGAHSVVLVTP